MKTARLPLFAAMLFAAVTSQGAQSATLYSCPFAGSGGDLVDRGFYVTNFPGSALGTVTLVYEGGSGDGAYDVSMTARLNAYDGTVIGSPQSRVVNVTGGARVTTTFDFGAAPVPPGSTVTFSQVLVSGPGPSPVLFYDVGVGPCANITQTNGTSPPLDSFRRDSVGVTITDTSVAPPPPVVNAIAVPTLDEYPLALLAVLLAAAGFVARAQQRRSRR